MESAVEEKTIKIINRAKWVYRDILEAKYIGANFSKGIEMMLDNQQHTCNNNFLIENIDTENYTIECKSHTALGVDLCISTMADYVYADIDKVNGTIIKFIIEDIKQGTILLRSELFKYHLEANRMAGYMIYKDEHKTTESLVSNKNKRVFVGKKLYIKVKSYIACDKEDTFIVHDGEFIDTD